MNLCFQKLFSIEFHHEYFGHKTAPRFIGALPFIINNLFQLQIKDFQNGFFIFLNNLANSRMDTFKQENKLDISPIYIPLKVLDNDFFNYSTLEYRPQKVTCLSFKQNEDENGLFTMDTPLDIQPCQFLFPLKLKVLMSIKAISLLNPLGVKSNLPLPSAPFKKGYPLNLSGELEGEYELKIQLKDNREIKYKFFFSDYLQSNPTPFVLKYKINLNKYVTNSKSISYTLSFNTLSTYWRYIFTGIKPGDWDEVEIHLVEIDNLSVNFKKATQSIILENGLTAFTALSTSPIKLRNRPKCKIYLHYNGFSEKILLPYPHPSNLALPSPNKGTIVDSSNHFFSDIYCQL